jgi:hypothetical protein
MIRIIVILSVILFFVGIPQIDATLYEKYSYGRAEDLTDNLKVTYYNQTFSGILQHNDETVEFDKIPITIDGEKFRIRDNENKIRIWGENIEDKKYKLSILLLGDKREILNFQMYGDGEKQIIHKPKFILPDYLENQNLIGPLIKLEEYNKKLQKITGLLHVETQKKLEEEKRLLLLKEKEIERIKNTERPDYELSLDKEIKINLESPGKIPWYKSFGFDLRIVDPDKNKFNSYWQRAGYVDDVEIVSTIKDPNGKILNKFTGNTADSGTFASDYDTTFSYNTFLNGEYTLDILATKYFDESATFATASLLKEFDVYVPSTSVNVDRYPPTGTIIIVETSPGISNTLTPDLNLTCDDYDRYNILVSGGCSTMAFALDTPDFVGATEYPFTETFVYPEDLVDGNTYIIFVQFTDNFSNKSTEIISDTITIELP